MLDWWERWDLSAWWQQGNLWDLHGYGPRLLEGAGVTLQLALLAVALALVLGLLTASARLSRSCILRTLAMLYTTVIRGVPDLVLMLLLFFGGQMALNMLTDAVYDHLGLDWRIHFNAFAAGVLTIGFIFGAYMGETFRGAFLAVEHGAVEAGKAYGMGPWLVFWRIRFPLMMRHALPGLSNNWMVLLKTTALVSIIGLSDLVRIAAEASRATHEPFTFLLPVAMAYLLIASLSEMLFRWLRRRYDTGFETR